MNNNLMENAVKLAKRAQNGQGSPASEAHSSVKFLNENLEEARGKEKRATARGNRPLNLAKVGRLFPTFANKSAGKLNNFARALSDNGIPAIVTGEGKKSYIVTDLSRQGIADIAGDFDFDIDLSNPEDSDFIMQKANSGDKQLLAAGQGMTDKGKKSKNKKAIVDPSGVLEAYDSIEDYLASIGESSDEEEEDASDEAPADFRKFSNSAPKVAESDDEDEDDEDMEDEEDDEEDMEEDADWRSSKF